MRLEKRCAGAWPAVLLALALAVTGCTSSSDSDDDDDTGGGGDSGFDILDYTLLDGAVEETSDGCLETDITGGSVAFNTAVDEDVVRIILEGTFLLSRYRFHLFGTEGETEVQDGFQARFERNDGADTSTMALYDTTGSSTPYSSSMSSDLASGDDFTQAFEFDRTDGTARVWETNADSDNDSDLFTGSALGSPVGTVMGLQSEAIRLCAITVTAQ